jgi:hypothetical protein
MYSLSVYVQRKEQSEIFTENIFSAKEKRDLCLLYIQIHKCKKDKKKLYSLSKCVQQK